MVKFLSWSTSILLTYLCTALTVSADRQTAPVRELPADPRPCNDFPDYYKIPVNRFFWLGAHDVASQDRSVTEMLRDGIRLLDLNLCSSPKDTIVACSDSTVSLLDLADEIFNYAREQEEQIITVHVNLSDDISLSTFEKTWDQVCKVHTERLEGVDPFVKGQCPFIYKKSGQWETLGELVGYDPEMPQWEGDGELVGVRSKIILTTSRKRQNTAYFSENLWRSTISQDVTDLNVELSKLCKTPGAIEIQGFAPTFNEDSKSTMEKKTYFDAALWENAITSSNGCNIDQTGAGVYFNTILVDQYHYQLPYLLELQGRMIPVNFAKSQSKKVKIEPSKLVKVHHPHDRDEL